jgi:hypothetical protein
MIVEFKRLTRVLPTVYLNLLRHLDKFNLKKIRLKWSGITVHLGRRLPGGSTHERVAANNTSAKDGAQTRVKSNWTQGREGRRHATAPKRTGGYCAPSGRPMGTNLLPFYDTGIRQHLVMTILKLGQLPRMFFVEFMVQFIDFCLCLIQGSFP